MTDLPSEQIVFHELESRFQSGKTSIRVLKPTAHGQQPCRTLYLLPVEPGEGRVWGDPIPDVLKHDLHNLHSMLVVMPTFSAMPWYVNHPSNQRLQQESYFVEDVVHFIDKAYPQQQGAERLLLGFSKSGFGAFSLLLRHPALFAKAAAWDAPLGMASFNKYGAAPIFGTQANFDAYDVWSALQENAPSLSDLRFGLFGYDQFRGHMQAAHFKMMKRGIPHHYADGPRRKHAWDGGWLPELVEFLASPNVT